MNFKKEERKYRVLWKPKADGPSLGCRESVSVKVLFTRLALASSEKEGMDIPGRECSSTPHLDREGFVQSHKKVHWSLSHFALSIFLDRQWMAGGDCVLVAVESPAPRTMPVHNRSSIHVKWLYKLFLLVDIATRRLSQNFG